MTAAGLVYQFHPTLYPVGKVVFHLPGWYGREVWDDERGWEAVPDDAPRSDEQRWASRTACGRLTYWATKTRNGEPATWSRRDHAELLGRLCKRCAKAADR